MRAEWRVVLEEVFERLPLGAPAIHVLGVHHSPPTLRHGGRARRCGRDPGTQNLTAQPADVRQNSRELAKRAHGHAVECGSEVLQPHPSTGELAHRYNYYYRVRPSSSLSFMNAFFDS